MHVLVIYESEFGATRSVAEAVARGCDAHCAALVSDVRRLDPGALTWADALILGAPTHARTMPTPTSREQAFEWTLRSGSTLKLAPDANEPGMREWLDGRVLAGLPVAAFATRVNMNRVLSGSAAPRIQRAAVRGGASALGAPHDFLVDRGGALVAGELERAEAWGRELCAAAATFEPTGVRP